MHKNKVIEDIKNQDDILSRVQLHLKNINGQLPFGIRIVIKFDITYTIGYSSINEGDRVYEDIATLQNRGQLETTLKSILTVLSLSNRRSS